MNHLAAHVAVDVLEHGPLPEPMIALLVSGGHSSLLLVADLTGDIRPLGRTIDDAAGEAFDKVARLLGLPFPGGPQIDRAARAGDPAAIGFPRGLTAPHDLRRHRYDFSLLRAEDGRRPVGGDQAGARGSRCRWPTWRPASRRRWSTCSPRKAVTACQEQGVDHLLLGGGVAANSRLRALAEQRCAAAGIRLRVPRPGLCTDNGAMVAALGALMVLRGRPPSRLDLPADSSMPVELVRA